MKLCKLNDCRFYIPLKLSDVISYFGLQHNRKASLALQAKFGDIIIPCCINYNKDCDARWLIDGNFITSSEVLRIYSNENL